VTDLRQRPARVRRSGPGARRPAPSVLPVLLVLLVIVAAPLLMVLVTAVTGYDGEPSALGDLADGDLPRVLGNTVWLSTLVVVFSTVMAAPLAFLTSWTPLRRHWWIDIVVMVPFMTPPFVAAMAWMDVTRLGGVADMVFGDLVGSAVRGTVNSVWGMALIMSCELFPFLYLLLRNCLDSVPASTVEMAAVVGASRWTRFSRIIAPQVIGPWSLGALIVFVRAAGEFGTPVTLGNAIGFEVLVSRIHRDVTVDPLDFSSASVAASMLFTLGIGVWCLQQWIGRGQDAGGGVRRPVRITLRGGGRALGWSWVAVVALVAVIVPYISILLGATTVLRSKAPTPDNLTLDYFSIVLGDGRAREALTTSALLGAVGATAAVLLGLAVVLVTALRSRRGTTGGTGTTGATGAARPAARLTDFLAVAPETVPAIVLAIGLIFLWNSRWLPATPYNTPWILVIAYAALFLPMAVQNIKTSAQAVSPSVFEAAAVAGASSWLAFRRITLPLLVPGLVAGWLLAFLTGIRELVMASLIRPSDMTLLAPWIMGQFDQGHRAEAMAMTVIGVVSSTVVLLVVQLWLRRRSVR
jgi:iron(III) transport system permease protein